MATPTSAAASAGASLTPSPTITGPSAFPRSTAATFSAGRALRQHAVDARAAAPTVSATVLPVARTQHHRAMPARRSARSARGVGPQRIAPAAARRRARRRPRRSTLAPSSAGAGGRRARRPAAGAADEAGAAERHRRPSTTPAMPAPGRLRHAARERRGAARARAPHAPAPRQHCCESLLQRSGEAQHLVAPQPSGASTAISRARPGSACRSCRASACAPAPASRAPAALDQHAGARGARHAGDDRHRHGQDQRAGVATTSTASARTGSPETSQAVPAIASVSGQEARRPAVGEPDERRLAGLRLSHQPDDAGIGALGGGRVGAISKARRH